MAEYLPASEEQTKQHCPKGMPAVGEHEHARPIDVMKENESNLGRCSDHNYTDQNRGKPGIVAYLTMGPHPDHGLGGRSNEPAEQS